MPVQLVIPLRKGAWQWSFALQSLTKVDEAQGHVQSNSCNARQLCRMPAVVGIRVQVASC